MPNASQKFIFVTGGIASSLGKGISASALGSLLELQGMKVAFQKIDPYLNVDSGTMSPYEHGEVFVTQDGAETDLDLGNYERFTDFKITKNSSVTTGKIYQHVIEEERKGSYLGKTVQVIPHITNEIKSRIYKVATDSQCDVLIVEIGGTVGDIESYPFLEAIRQFGQEVGINNRVFIHLTLVPVIGSHGELKTKLTQHSVRELRSIGIEPDIILCRSSESLTQEAKEKISLFCNVKITDVVEALNVKHSIYEVPLKYHQAHLDTNVLEKLALKPQKNLSLERWEKIVHVLKNPKRETSIAVIGKYMEFEDAYKSLYEAILHGAIQNGGNVLIDKIESDSVQIEDLKKYSGIIIPGGFGSRGVESMIKIIQYARENKVPLLGICLGMQLISVEYARNVLGLKGANSEEFDSKTPHPVIALMEKQKETTLLGGTMRLGAYEASLKKDSKIYNLYQQETILERHRHRFEFNNDYIKDMEKNGLAITGYHKNILVESVEVKDHPFMIGVQYHPELISKPYSPHPLFGGFIKSCF